GSSFVMQPQRLSKSVPGVDPRKSTQIADEPSLTRDVLERSPSGCAANHYSRAGSSSELLRGAHAGQRLEVLAIGAVTDVELVADDRKPHRVRTEQQLAVFDGVEAEIGWDRRGSAAVPAGAVTVFRLDCHAFGRYFVCCGTYPGGSAAPSPKKKSSMCLATR